MPATSKNAAYEKRKAYAGEKSRQSALLGREIGPLPAVANPERRTACERDFRLFCEAYMAQTFSIPWSPDHLKAIRLTQVVVLEGGQFALAMPRGNGKALALDTPIPTASGWAAMADLRVGDLVYGSDGRPCRVTFATEVLVGRPCFRVEFDDGESVICDADHLWSVHDRYARQNPQVLRTEDMAGRVVLSTKRRPTERRYTIPICGAITGTSARPWHVHPYVLGAWLGNGTSSTNAITIGDHDLEAMRSLLRPHESLDDDGHRVPGALAATYRLGRGGRVKGGGPLTAESIGACAGSGKPASLRARLRWLGVLGNKHVPGAYLRASVEDRLELLRGLMDTDGSMAKNGSSAEFVTKRPQLRDDVMDLLAGLGFKRRCRTKIVIGRPYYRITFAPTDGRRVFNVERKWARQQTRSMRVSATRRIVSIEPVPSVPVRCIQVDAPDRLYLCGRGMVPTHNTSLCEAAALWAIVYGHRRFPILIGATETHADELLEHLAVELEHNDHLAEDFPEVCHGIRALQGIANRAKGQLLDGERTLISWTQNELVLPTVGGSKASGSVVRVAGITGRIRGMSCKRPDGETMRPDLVLVDDPQTDSSSRSLTQCAERERVLAKAVLGLGGPKEKIAALMPCTVIRPGDVADNLLDRKKHPEWNGVRTKLIYELPTSKLWEKYAEVRAESFRKHGDIRDATEYYGLHREEMDVGARVAWPERFKPGELSAVQCAMNLKIEDESAFQSEYQNDPLPEQGLEDDGLTADAVAQKLNGYAERVVPVTASRLTAFIDVQKDVLFWLVAAWSDDFTGNVVAYGSWPDQQRDYFSLGDVQRTLARAVPKAGLEGSIYAGLEKLCGEILGREWLKDDATPMRVDRALIDANWGESTNVVYTFCRQTAHAAVVMPSHGRYIGPSSRPMEEWSKKPGDRIGAAWRVPGGKGRRAVQHVLFDTNHWKSFVHARLVQPIGDSGCLAFYGRNPHRHRMISEHLTAERRERLQGSQRTVDVWSLRPGKRENHLLDCIVGAAVAASMAGAALPGLEGERPKQRQRVKLSDLQRGRRAG